jgi:hypothetical protein
VAPATPAFRRLPRTIVTNATAARTPIAVRLARFSAVHGVNNSTPTTTTVAEVTSPVRNVRLQLTSVHQSLAKTTRRLCGAADGTVKAVADRDPSHRREDVRLLRREVRRRWMS